MIKSNIISKIAIISISKECLIIKKISTISIILILFYSFFPVCIAYAEEDYWPYSTNSYSYTNTELDNLAKTIDCEARGESMKGKIAVGNVIMNRVFVYNSNITSIVTAANQFTYSYERTPTAESFEAAKRVLQSEEWVVPQNCYYFKTTGPPSGGSQTWSGKSTDPIEFWKKIGNHYFYVRNLDGRYNGNDVPAPMFQREYDSPRIGIIPSEEVVKVQEMLIACGYQVTADGYFGDFTHKAVKDFQSKNQLSSDGIVGNQTLSALEIISQQFTVLVKPDELDNLSIEAKKLISSINKRKLSNIIIDNIVLNSISVFKINQMANTLRHEYAYSIDSVSLKVAKENYYLVSPE